MVSGCMGTIRIRFFVTQILSRALNASAIRLHFPRLDQHVRNLYDTNERMVNSQESVAYKLRPRLLSDCPCAVGS